MIEKCTRKVVKTQLLSDVYFNFQAGKKMLRQKSQSPSASQQNLTGCVLYNFGKLATFYTDLK